MFISNGSYYNVLIIHCSRGGLCIMSIMDYLPEHWFQITSYLSGNIEEEQVLVVDEQPLGADVKQLGGLTRSLQ